MAIFDNDFNGNVHTSVVQQSIISVFGNYPDTYFKYLSESEYKNTTGSQFPIVWNGRITVQDPRAMIPWIGLKVENKIPYSIVNFWKQYEIWCDEGAELDLTNLPRVCGDVRVWGNPSKVYNRKDVRLRKCERLEIFTDRDVEIDLCVDIQELIVNSPKEVKYTYRYDGIEFAQDYTKYHPTKGHFSTDIVFRRQNHEYLRHANDLLYGLVDEQSM